MTDREGAAVTWTNEEDEVLLKAVKQARYRVYSNETQLGAYVSRQLLHKNMHECVARLHELNIDIDWKKMHTLGTDSGG
jgi:hypothetical protein